jgi:hypothetical protein
MRRWFLTIFASGLVLGGCLCGGGTSTGECTGSIGTVDVTGPLDRSSEHHRIWNPSPDQTELNLSCGGGQLVVRARTRRMVALPASEEELPHETCTQVPLPAPDGGTDDGGQPDAGFALVCQASGSDRIFSWEILAPTGHPKLTGGVLEAALHALSLQGVGHARMEFEDGSSVTITFDVRLDESLDEGEKPSSSGSGGSDSDD